MSDRPLQGRAALVTGAGVRLGRAIALGLARAGADVVVHYRASQAGAEETAAAVRELGRRAWTVRADLADLEALGGLMARATGMAGPLHILVNSASIFFPSTVADVSFAQMVENLTINAWAPLELSRQFAAQNIDAGHIVNLLDTRLVGFDLRHVAYIVSKHALAQLTRMTALEFAPRVAVNAVAPGLILPPAGQDESYLAHLSAALPLKRHGGPEDVVEAVLYLVRTRFVTGQVIFVDGGRHLREQGDGLYTD